MPLKIESWTEGRIAHLVLAGEMDSNSVSEICRITSELLSSSPDHLVLRVNELVNLSSAALRNLIFARQKHPGLQIHFIRPVASLVNMLKDAGFYESIYVWDGDEQDRADAAAIGHDLPVYIETAETNPEIQGLRAEASFSKSA